MTAPRTHCADCGSPEVGWWRQAYNSQRPSGDAASCCKPCYNARVRARYGQQQTIRPCRNCGQPFTSTGRQLLCEQCKRTNPQKWSGRPARRLQMQVFTEESHCWICGLHVDQTLPPNHNQARSIDHVIPRSRGGAVFDRDNVRLAHRACNAERGISPAQVTQRIAELERALTEIDPGHPLLVTRGYPAPHRV